MAVAEIKRGSEYGDIIRNPDWKILGSRTHECRVLICPAEEGGFTARAIRLPGVVGEGETIDEALADISDAFEATVGIYLEIDGVIPWQDKPIPRPKNCEERWVLVNA